jgi:hypothetical protein
VVVSFGAVEDYRDYQSSLCLQRFTGISVKLYHKLGSKSSGRRPVELVIGSIGVS